MENRIKCWLAPNHPSGQLTTFSREVATHWKIVLGIEVIALGEVGEVGVFPVAGWLKMILDALCECDEAMSYMSEYDIPLGLPHRVRAALDAAINAGYGPIDLPTQGDCGGNEQS